jgi:hypothetical protein
MKIARRLTRLEVAVRAEAAEEAPVRARLYLPHNCRGPRPKAPLRLPGAPGEVVIYDPKPALAG